MSRQFSEISVRLGILNQIKAMYSAVTDEENPPAPKKNYGIRFSVVAIGPLSDPDLRKQFSIGIVASTEKKSDLYQLAQNQFDITIEFRAVVNQGDDDPGILAERVLAIVQQVIYDDRTIGGLVIDTHEIGSTIDLVTYSDRTIVGLVIFQVLYRHSPQDVYDPNPSI